MGHNSVQIDPVDASFGATVSGVQVRSLDEPTWQVLHRAWLEYGLLIFPGQYLSRDEQNDFARRFGELEFAAAPISNIGRSGTIHSDPADDVVKAIRGNEGWHHDSTYMPLQAKGAVFTAETVPSNGAPTGFADMRAAYEALDPATQHHLGHLLAYHSLFYSQARAGYMPSKTNDRGGYDAYGYHDGEPSLRPLVKIHPETGRPNLCIGRHAYGIIGMDPIESEALLDRLVQQACQAPRIHYHRWTEGDAIVWDNRRLLHCATEFDLTEPRRMWHTRIAGERASELAVNYA